MLQVFHLYVVKVDLDPTYVVVGSIFSSHLLQQLDAPACEWLWRGCHAAGVGHEARAGHSAGTSRGVSAGHGAVRPPI